MTLNNTNHFFEQSHKAGINDEVKQRGCRQGNRGREEEEGHVGTLWGARWVCPQYARPKEGE